MDNQTESLKELRSLFFEVKCLMRERIPGKSHANTWLRLETLFYINEHPGASMGDVARYLHIAPPSASSLIRSLARTGFVRRENASDRRRTKLILTAPGLKELRRGERVSMEAMRSVFGRLSARDVSSLHDTLQRAIALCRR